MTDYRGIPCDSVISMNMKMFVRCLRLTCEGHLDSIDFDGEVVIVTSHEADFYRIDSYTKIYGFASKHYYKNALKYFHVDSYESHSIFRKILDKIKYIWRCKHAKRYAITK